jgi:NAD(P)-dependent dehydrogenase (short-subunit alcohol dehydrogenase family)
MTTRGHWEDTSVELFDRTYNLNVRAPFLLMQAAAALMARDGAKVGLGLEAHSAAPHPGPLSHGGRQHPGFLGGRPRTPYNYERHTSTRRLC